MILWGFLLVCIVSIFSLLGVFFDIMDGENSGMEILLYVDVLCSFV